MNENPPQNGEPRATETDPANPGGSAPSPAIGTTPPEPIALGTKFGVQASLRSALLNSRGR